MSTTTPTSSLEDERKYIEQRIAYWQSIIDNARTTIAKLKNALEALHPTAQAQEVIPFEQSTHSRYRNKSIIEAAVDFLNAHGQPANAKTIRDGLERGGWETKAKRPTASIYGTLHQHAENSPDRKIRNIGDGLWSLTEWDEGNKTGIEDSSGDPISE